MRNLVYLLFVCIVYFLQVMIGNAQSYSIQDEKMVVIGEIHTERYLNNKLKIVMFDELLTKYDSIIILEEKSPGYINYVNKYFDVNDYKSLTKHLDDYFTIDDTLFYFYIHEKIQDLDSSKNILIKGIDVETADIYTIYSMIDILPAKMPDILIYDYIYRLDRLALKNKLKKKRAQKLLIDIKNNNKKHPEQYKSYLEDNYNLFFEILEGLLLELSYNEKDYLAPREELLYKRIKKISEEYPGYLLFGQFGLVHVAQDIYDNRIGNESWESFTYKLIKREKDFNISNVSSFAIYYKNSSEESYFTKNIADYLLNDEGRKYIEQYKEDDFTIFKICDDEKEYINNCNLYDYIILCNVVMYQNAPTQSEE